MREIAFLGIMAVFIALPVVFFVGLLLQRRRGSSTKGTDNEVMDHLVNTSSINAMTRASFDTKDKPT
jgi:preprotein translocase subunit SecG